MSSVISNKQTSFPLDHMWTKDLPTSLQSLRIKTLISSTHLQGVPQFPPELITLEIIDKPSGLHRDRLLSALPTKLQSFTLPGIGPMTANQIESLPSTLTYLDMVKYISHVSSSYIYPSTHLIHTSHTWLPNTSHICHMNDNLHDKLSQKSNILCALTIYHNLLCSMFLYYSNSTDWMLVCVSHGQAALVTQDVQAHITKLGNEVAHSPRFVNGPWPHLVSCDQSTA